MKSGMPDTKGPNAPTPTDRGHMAAYGHRLAELGYPIVPIARGEKRPLISGWQNRTEAPTDKEIDAWVHQYPGCGIGIVTCGAIGIEIDVEDPFHAAACVKIVFDHLGPTSFVRIGRAPRLMLIYRMPEQIKGRKPHPFEFIAKGQQFVAFHVHPDTGQPYTWPEKSILETPASELPVTHPGHVSSMLKALADYARAHNINKSGRVEERAPDEQQGTGDFAEPGEDGVRP